MPADLETLVAARDHRGVAAVLLGLEGVDLDDARRWYRRAGRRLAREHGSELDPVRDPDGGTVVLLLAVALSATGRDAARTCAFSDVHLSERAEGARLLAVLELAARRGPGWSQDFVDAAGEVGVRRAWDVSPELLQLCLPLIEHHRLVLPPGPGYVLAWTEMATHLQRAHLPRWGRDLARLDEDGHATPVATRWTESGLDAYLRASPLLEETLEHVLGTPAALGRLGDLDQAGWSVEAGLRSVVADGTVDREALLAATLGTFARSDRPSEQRVAVRLLAALDLGPSDVASRVPFLLQVLPTVHGSVTAALLPALLGAALEPSDLVEAGTTVLLRKEKAQKVVLLDRLGALGPDDPLAVAAVDLASQAALLDDRTLSARADQVLERLRVGPGDAPPGPTDVAVEVPWDDPPVPEPAAPFRPGGAGAAGLARLRTDDPLDPLRQARWLDAVVRFATADPEGLRTEVATMAADEPELPAASRWGAVLRAWAAGTPRSVGSVTVQGYGFGPLAELLAVETALRLGTSPTLLSTPSSEDGVVAFDDLVARLRAAATSGYGPVDLLSALLRLEPTAPARLDELDSLEVGPWDQAARRHRWWQRRTPAADDAVGVVRAWVDGGGLPVRVAEVAGGRARCPAVRLPAVPPGLADHPVVVALGAAVEVEAGTPHWQRWRTTWLDPSVALGVVPSWSEAVAADQECSVPENRGWPVRWFADLVRAPGPLGPAVHLLAARLLGAPAAPDRALAVDVVLDAIGRRRLDPDLFARHSLHWSTSGLAPLVRTCESWEQVVLGGGLAFLWPTLRAVLQSSSTTSPRPAGLADLLRMLRPYTTSIAAHVPGPVWPDGVAELARSSSATKARAEARALVEAVAAHREAA